MDRTHTVVDSPVGQLTLIAENGALTGLYLERYRHGPAKDQFGEPNPAAFGTVRAQLAEYFAADRTDFDLPLAMAGTPFQRSVWAELRRIPFGQTISYGELADRLGKPTAARAVGLANGRNPISIIVPCHRVIGSGGDLTGYGGGIENKRWLLDFERSTR